MNKVLPKKIFIIVYVFVFITMFVLNCYTPMVSDDYAHYYGTEDVHPTTLREILHNMVNFRKEINGRVLSHFFVYIFLAAPRSVFWVVNALVAAAIAVSASKFFISQWNVKSLLIVVSSIFAVWVFTPSFGEIYLWLTGSINYSWGLLLDLVLIYPFFCCYTGRKCIALNKKHTAVRVLLSVLAFIVGAYSENGSIATVCVIALLGLLIWINEKKFPLYLFSVFACACIGFFFLMTAPATLQGRAGGNISEHIWYCRILTQKYMTVLWSIYVLLFIIALKKKAEKKVLIFTVILFIASVLSIAVFIFAIYLPPRSFMIAVTFSVLANSCLVSEIWDEKINSLMMIIPAAVIVFFVFSFQKGCKDIVFLYHLQKDRESRIAEAISNNDFDVYLPRFVTETDYSACPEEELSTDSQYWYNNLIARYYSLNSVTAQTENNEE